MQAQLLPLASSLEQIGGFFSENDLVVYMLSFVICGFFSFIMLTSYPRAKTEKWMKYFGIALGIFAAEHLSGVVMGVVKILIYGGQPLPTKLKMSTMFILQILSTANNIYFIASAREIENKKPAVPRWCWWFAGGAFLTAVVGRSVIAFGWLQSADSPHLWEFLARGGDDIFSVVNLVLLGRAICMNLSFRVHRRSAFAAILVALFYALLYAAHWFSPLIAPSLFTKGMPIFDSLWSVVSLPAEFILFYLAYSVFQRVIEILHDLTKMREKSVDVRQDYLSSDGAVRWINEKLDGDVELVILLPGTTERRLASIPWPSDDPELKAKIRTLNQVEEGIRKSLMESKPILSSPKDKPPFTAIMPIVAHGVAIGCLKISRAKYRFSQMAVRQIKAIANLLSPAVQSYRELAALDLLSIRFAEKQSDEKSCPPEEAAKIIAGILHEVFSPATTRVAFSFGFQTIEPVYRGDDEIAQFIETRISGSDWDQIPLEFSGKDFKLFKKKLTAKSEDIAAGIDRPRIGNLIFAILKADDKLGHPTLGTSYLHRKAAATLASDAYFDFARDYFGNLVKNFGARLSRRRMSVEDWFGPVRGTARKAGLPWVIAVTEGEKILGESSSLTLACISEPLQDQRALSTIHESEAEGVKIYSHALANPLEGARHIIEIRLAGSKTTIWMGVERPGFKNEIEFNSPWKNFLVDFARIADAALTRIIFAIKLQRKQQEAANYQVLAVAAVATGTLLHQLRNLAHGYSASASALLDALAAGELVTSAEIQARIHSMKRSAEWMKTFLSNITKATKTGDHRPSRLLDAVKQAANMFEAALLQRKINLRPPTDTEIWVDVQFDVVTYAIANLIGNAKDAMPNGGEIRIEAENNGKAVVCRVIDQGPGIPEAIKGEIFDIGFSTKNGEGSGWGLWLTKQSLEENRSKIELTETSEKGSTFTIYFPKAAQERS